jgi:hypothetical protein
MRRRRSHNLGSLAPAHIARGNASIEEGVKAMEQARDALKDDRCEDAHRFTRVATAHASMAAANFIGADSPRGVEASQMLLDKVKGISEGIAKRCLCVPRDSAADMPTEQREGSRISLLEIDEDIPLPPPPKPRRKKKPALTGARRYR